MAMTIADVKAKHKLTDEQVADYADKYIRGRERQKKSAKGRRGDLAALRALSETPEGKRLLDQIKKQQGAAA